MSPAPLTAADFEATDLVVLGEYLTRELRREYVRFTAWQREANRSRGVSMSGMGPGPFEPRTVEQLLNLARAAKARQENWIASPAGRFHKAALTIAKATGDEGLLACVHRGLETNHQHAAKLLLRMEGPAADECRKALADFVADLLADQVAA